MKSSLLILWMSFVLTGCDSCKTTANSNDKTPPDITWHIQNKTQGTDVDLSGNASYNAKLGDDLLITACGVDDGGLKGTTALLSSGYTCISNNIAQNVGPGLAAVTTTPLGLDANGKAWSKYCAFITMNLQFGCDQGFTFASGNAGANLKVLNYGNVSSNASLAISVSP